MTPNTSSQQARLSPAKRALLEKRLRGELQSMAKIQAIPQRPYESPAPLSFAQQRLWFLHQLNPDSSVYNIPIAIRINGQLNIAALEQSFNEVIKRHEVLRTTFPRVNGQPVANISPALHLKLSLVDLQHLPDNERENETRQLATEEAMRCFDLTQGPLLRVTIFQLQEAKYVLLLVVHHIIFDEWSLGLLVRELGVFYTASIQGEAAALAELPIQYADFAYWQRQRLQGDFLQTQLDYWQKHLNLNNLPILGLPTDRARPPVQNYRGATQSSILSKPLSQALKNLSQQEDATLFMTLLAAFQLLLHRYTGQEDILVGTPVANRTHSELEQMIGLFVNTLVLRTNFSGSPSFQTLLRRVRQAALEAYSHQELPFELPVEKLESGRDLSRHPLFQVMFVFQPALEDTLGQLELSVSPFELDNNTAKFDLTLFMQDTEQGLTISFEYNTDLFEAETITRMMGHFQMLLEGIVSNPEQSVSTLPLLTIAEQNQLLAWNDTHTPYPSDVCLHHLFEKQVEQTPQAIAVEFEDQHLSYRELNKRANQLAHYLQSLGVGPETLVGIFMDRSLEMMVGLLGILKAGGAYLPLDPENPPERLNLILEDAQTKLLLTQQHLVANLPDNGPHLICLDTTWPKVASQPDSNLIDSSDPTNLAYVIYTSGSTGKPKGVAIPHRGVVNYLTWSLQAYPLQAGTGAPVHSSISFDLTITGLFAPLLAGRTVHLLPNDLAVETLATALQNKGIYSLVKITPAHLELLGQQLSTQEAAGCTHAFIIGGEQLLAENISFWQAAAPDILLINEYGPTETVVGCCIYQVPVGQYSSGPIPIGHPIANTQLYVLDTNLQPVPIGVPGELYIGGAGMARGYLNRPDLTAEKFIPNPFASATEEEKGGRLYKTGDLARYLPDGNLEFLGRIDQQVKIRGYRIELGEIEAILRQHPAIQEAVANVWEDIPGYKSLLVAYLVAPKKPRLDELRRYMRARLPEYMLPSAFVFIDEVPLAANGKVNRRALPPPVQALHQRDETFTGPRDTLEHQLTDLWEETLNVHPISIKDNFFEIGGHSLLAVRLFAQIEEKLGRNLPVVTLFQAPTIEQLAWRIRISDEAASTASSLVAVQPNGSRPPFFCVHGMGGGVLDYVDLARYLGPNQPFYALQERALAEPIEPFTSVEAMADHYIKVMQIVQPQGPYYVGGYCYGGTIAFEIAQQLYKYGKQVALVAVIDNWSPVRNNQALWSFGFWVDFLKNLPYWLRDFLQLSPQQMLARIKRKFAVLLEDRHQVTHSVSDTPSLADLEAVLDMDLSDIPAKHHRILAAHYKAMLNYTPKPYPGRVTLFKTRRRSLFGPFDPYMGWDCLAIGGVDIREVVGFHGKLLLEPDVQNLAEQIHASLDQAQGQTFIR